MSASRAVVTALAVAVALTGCGQKKPAGERRKAASAAAPVSGGGSAGQEMGVAPGELAPRRERAGIETEPAPRAVSSASSPGLEPPQAAVPPQAFVAELPGADRATGVSPAVDEARQIDIANRVLRFVTDRWAPALRSGDLEAYGALLLDDFRGFSKRDGEARVLERDAWLAEVAREVRRGIPIVLGPAEVTVTPGPELRPFIRLYERRGRGAACREETREITVLMRGDEIHVANEDPITSKPCTAADAAAVAAGHERLRRALQGGDEATAAGLVNDDLWVRRHGLVAGWLTRAELASDKGRWALAWLRSGEADLDNTTSFGGLGVIDQGGGVRIVYARSGSGWRLAGLELGDIEVGTPPPPKDLSTSQ